MLASKISKTLFRTHQFVIALCPGEDKARDQKPPAEFELLS
jgi:hypothetical protein